MSANVFFGGNCKSFAPWLSPHGFVDFSMSVEPFEVCVHATANRYEGSWLGNRPDC